MAKLPHDFYHLPSYAKLGAGQDRGHGGAFIVDEPEGQLLVPMVLRAPLNGHVDAVSPYGYPAPVWSPGSSPAFVRQAIGAFVEALRRERVVSAFVRLHPLLTHDLEPLEAAGEVVAGAETVYIDLTDSSEQLWRDTRENHRRSIRRLEKSGFAARCDAGWERLDDFLVAYHETMKRVDAASYYFFSKDYYADLRSALGGNLHLLLVEQGSQVAAAALFTECSGLVQYHLGGTRDEFLPNAPMTLLFNFARTWFKERGARLLHFGGGVGSQQDSLLHFKAGFSSRRARFHSWRLITAPEAYDELVADWRKAAGREPRGTFFPAYREPL